MNDEKIASNFTIEGEIKWEQLERVDYAKAAEAHPAEEQTAVIIYFLSEY